MSIRLPSLILYVSSICLLSSLSKMCTHYSANQLPKRLKMESFPLNLNAF